jgi:hypothetical protein
MTRVYLTTGIRIIAILIAMFLLLWLVVSSNGVLGSTFATGSGTGSLELLIDSTSIYNGVLQPQLSWQLKDLKPGVDHFFQFNDIKPGDQGTTTISVHVKKNAAWVCLDFLNLKDMENGRNEPEGIVDANNTGELSKELEFFAWRDDGDKHFEIGEQPLFGATGDQSAIKVLKGQSYALADSIHKPAYQPNQTKYIGIAWCAGNLSVNVATAQVSCDGKAMGNEAQTDSMSLDVSIRAVAADQQSKFTCTSSNDDSHDEHNDDGHGKDEGHKNNDDNHHDDKDHEEWHQVSDSDSAWSKTKQYCTDVWDKVTKGNKHS